MNRLGYVDLNSVYLSVQSDFKSYCSFKTFILRVISITSKVNLAKKVYIT